MYVAYRVELFRAPESQATLIAGDQVMRPQGKTRERESIALPLAFACGNRTRDRRLFASSRQCR